nr:hypothetical protein [Agromyces seonyuensis]
MPRWWDGTTWAAHVGPGGARPPKAKVPLRDRLTRGVLVTAAIVLVAVLGTIVGGSVNYAQRVAANDALRPPAADEAVAEYLDALVAGRAEDADAMRSAEYRADLAALGTGATTIVGDATAAAANDLEIDYEVLDVAYYQEHPDNGDRRDDDLDFADEAVVAVRVDYALEVDGTPVTASSVQGFRLQRAFYYGSLDEPGFVEDGREPQARGPWAIVELQWNLDDAGLDGPFVVSDYTAPPLNAESAEWDRWCSSADDVLGGIADYALAENELLAECLANDAEFHGVAEDVDLDGFTSTLEPLGQSGDLPELVGLESVGEESDPPILQAVLPNGETELVFTMLLVDPTTTEYPEYRITTITTRQQ